MLTIIGAPAILLWLVLICTIPFFRARNEFGKRLLATCLKFVVVSIAFLANTQENMICLLIIFSPLVICMEWIVLLLNGKRQDDDEVPEDKRSIRQHLRDTPKSNYVALGIALAVAGVINLSEFLVWSLPYAAVVVGILAFASCLLCWLYFKSSPFWVRVAPFACLVVFSALLPFLSSTIGTDTGATLQVLYMTLGAYLLYGTLLSRHAIYGMGPVCLYMLVQSTVLIFAVFCFNMLILPQTVWYFGPMLEELIEIANDSLPF